MSNRLPFFAAAATFFQELAPIASPLAATLAETAAAIDRAQAISAGKTPRSLRSAAVHAGSYLPEDDDQ